MGISRRLLLRPSTTMILGSSAARARLSRLAAPQTNMVATMAATPTYRRIRRLLIFTFDHASSIGPASPVGSSPRRPDRSPLLSPAPPGLMPTPGEPAPSPFPPFPPLLNRETAGKTSETPSHGTFYWFIEGFAHGAKK